MGWGVSSYLYMYVGHCTECKAGLTFILDQQLLLYGVQNVYHSYFCILVAENQEIIQLSFTIVCVGDPFALTKALSLDYRRIEYND